MAWPDVPFGFAGVLAPLVCDPALEEDVVVRDRHQGRGCRASKASGHRSTAVAWLWVGWWRLVWARVPCFWASSSSSSFPTAGIHGAPSTAPADPQTQERGHGGDTRAGLCGCTLKGEREGEVSDVAKKTEEGCGCGRKKCKTSQFLLSLKILAGGRTWGLLTWLGSSNPMGSRPPGVTHGEREKGKGQGVHVRGPGLHPQKPCAGDMGLASGPLPNGRPRPSPRCRGHPF